MTYAMLIASICFVASADPAAADAASSGEPSPEVVRLLEKLEAAGGEVRTIKCDVVYKVIDNLNITETTRYGSIAFKRADPYPEFLIEFEKTNADGIILRDKEWWLFHDRWLIEAKEKSKNIIKREIVRPGEEADFFDLERSPFPIPFGQKKEQILRSFDVKLIPPQVGDPKNCDHLLCRPREDASLAEEYKRLDYYVSRDLSLPLRIVAEDARGDKISTADFPDLSEKNINVALPESAFKLPDQTKGYHETVEPLAP